MNALLGITEQNTPPPELDDEDNRVRAIICNHDDDDDQTASMYSMINVPEIDETHSQQALEMLKTHGISMMPEEDPSSNLVASAIQNGRKLVLSEGGKLVLNDAKKSAAHIQTTTKHIQPINQKVSMFILSLLVVRNLLRCMLKMVGCKD